MHYIQGLVSKGVIASVRAAEFVFHLMMNTPEMVGLKDAYEAIFDIITMCGQASYRLNMSRVSRQLSL